MTLSLQSSLSAANPPEAAVSMRALLREASAVQHAALDAGIGPLFAAGEDGYRVFLRASARALLPIEAALQRAGVATPLEDWPDRARSQALIEDIAAFGEAPRVDSDSPAMTGEASVLGALYVLEGSRLGGLWLLGHAMANASPRMQAATRYLGHGAGKAYWPTFLSRLEASDAARRAPAQAVAAAVETFDRFASAFWAEAVQ